MNTYNVELGERRYPIHIGPDLLTDGGLIRTYVPGSSVLVVTNETVAPLYLARVEAGLSGLRHAALVLPDGEEFKTLETLATIFDKLVELRFERGCTLVALGGGVIGDITGFAAACYQRGVHYIQVPTTLLAQVDSSVGGKTAVNHPLAKNMIGAFYQPRCVVADTSTLATLDCRDLRSGWAEVIKYGLIRDVAFFGWLELHGEALRQGDPTYLTHAIERSCANKAEVVAADELEQGQRALLNLGHTFGHAIEAVAGYGQWTHGEAVATGTCMAADLSRRMGLIEPQTSHRINHILAEFGLPVRLHSRMDREAFVAAMAVDKKVQDGRIKLVLLKAIGDALVSDSYPEPLLDETLTAFLEPVPGGS